MNGQTSHSLTAWIESLVLTSLGLGLCWYLNPSDPFLFESPFPWIWFAPVILALRYGIGPGMLSVFCITAAFMWQLSYESMELSYHRLYLLSGILLTLVCAEFSSLWYERSKRLQQAINYAELRLNSLNKAYHLLYHSHQHLEASLINKPVTLRTAIEACSQLVKASAGVLTQPDVIRFLDLLRFYCSIESCSFHEVRDGTVEAVPLAYYGDDSACDTNDILVRRALDNVQLNYAAVNGLDKTQHSQYLVVAPLADSAGYCSGLLVIKKMPFLLLNDENLQLLAILMSYYANQKTAIEQSRSLLEAFPDCPPDFALEVCRLNDISKKVRLHHALVKIEINPHPNREEIAHQLKRQHRGLDCVWMFEHGEQTILLLLMPFSGVHAVTGYQHRIEVLLQNTFSIKATDGIYRFRYGLLGAKEPESLMASLLEVEEVG
jgi:hypothetical protein